MSPGALYSYFKDNLWVVCFADNHLTNKCNKGFRFLLCVIDLFTKYVWVIPLKDQKGTTNVNTYQSILNDFGRTLNKIWDHQRSEFITILLTRG